jgi:hypothetical protein
MQTARCAVRMHMRQIPAMRRLLGQPCMTPISKFGSPSPSTRTFIACIPPPRRLFANSRCSVNALPCRIPQYTPTRSIFTRQRPGYEYFGMAKLCQRKVMPAPTLPGRVCVFPDLLQRCPPYRKGSEARPRGARAASARVLGYGGSRGRDGGFLPVASRHCTNNRSALAESAPTNLILYRICFNQTATRN